MLALTAEDVKRLLEDASADTRLSMTDKIAGAYGTSDLDGKESQIAEQIFRLLLRDTELKVRMSLSQHVKDSGQIPHDIVLSLAQDVEEVALPVLKCSEVLTDEDLVELMNATQEVSRYLAVSQREHVSEIVSDTLMEKGNEEVTTSLVSNTGAELSEASVQKIVDSGNESLIKAVTERPRLPVAAVEKLITVVSSNIAEHLKQKYKIPTEEIQKEVDKTRESETLNLVRGVRLDEEVDRLVSQLQAFGRLSPSIILSALCQGNFAFFETSLARLSNIPVANARTLITDRGDLGFRAIYNKSGLPEAMFPAVKLLLTVVRELDTKGEKPGSPRYANRIVERILLYAEETPVENLSYIIALIRRVA